jgi:D-lactate dehydrogenase
VFTFLPKKETRLELFFYEAFEEEAKELKRLLPESVSADFTGKTIQECRHRTPPARLISTRTQSGIPVGWAEELSGILSRSTGYDHLLAYRKDCKRSIPCGYLPLYCSRFHRDGLTGTECIEKTLLVVGVGNIGSEVVKIGQGLGMEVMGVDLVLKYPFVHYVSIDEGLPRADVIVCAKNLTSLNTGYFHYDLLRRAKNGAVFVNISRGEISPSVDLLRLLKEGHLGGAALDVYNNERDLAVSLRERRDCDNPEVQAALTLADCP